MARPLPVIAALRDRGQEWTAGPDRSSRLALRICSHDVALQLSCAECERVLTTGEIETQRAGDRASTVRPAA
jgi:hypothetical protein